LSVIEVTELLHELLSLEATALNVYVHCREFLGVGTEFLGSPDLGCKSSQKQVLHEFSLACAIIEMQVEHIIFL
jgi:hypothetical protein